MATSRKLDDARFIKHQNSRSLSFSLSLSLLARSPFLFLSRSLVLSRSRSLLLLSSLTRSPLSFACAPLSVSRPPFCFALRPSRTHVMLTGVNTPNCECTKNLISMNPQSNTKQTPSHCASPKGSVDGKHCELAESFSADGKRQAVPTGVVSLLDSSPSCSRTMSLMAIPRVSFFLSCSLLLSFACCLSLSLSLSHTHSVFLLFFHSVSVSLCAPSLSLSIPTHVNCTSLLQFKVFTSRSISRARAL